MNNKYKINGLRSNINQTKDKGKEGFLTSIEPEHNGLGIGILYSLEEPKEESAAALLVDCDVPGVVIEANIEGLAGEAVHFVVALLLGYGWVNGGRERDGEE